MLSLPFDTAGPGKVSRINLMCKITSPLPPVLSPGILAIFFLPHCLALLLLAVVFGLLPPVPVLSELLLLLSLVFAVDVAGLLHEALAAGFKCLPYKARLLVGAGQAEGVVVIGAVVVVLDHELHAPVTEAEFRTLIKQLQLASFPTPRVALGRVLVLELLQAASAAVGLALLAVEALSVHVVLVLTEHAVEGQLVGT